VKRVLAVIGILLAALVLMACGAPPTGPVVNVYTSNQAINDSPSAGAAPSPVPGTAEVSIGVLGGTTPGGGTLPRGTFSGVVGTVFFLDATARDLNHQPVSVHGPMQGWRVECTPAEAMVLEGDTSGFNPHLRILQAPSTCRVAAKVDGKEGMATFTGVR